MLRVLFAVVAAALRGAAVVLLSLPPLLNMTVARADDSATVLQIGGTGSALGGMRLLVARFGDLHADLHMEVLPSLGSGGGIKALQAGKIGLALSARPLKDDERDQGLRAMEYCRTPIVFGTRHDNAADNITLDQVAAAYAGEEFAWPDGTPVRLVMRPATETDTKLVRSLSPALDRAVESALKGEDHYVAIDDQDNADALEQIPGSLGLITIAQIVAERRAIKALALDGAVGSTEALRAGQYTHAKSLFLIVGPHSSPALDAFVAFVGSPEGQAILSVNGCLTVGMKPAT